MQYRPHPEYRIRVPNLPKYWECNGSHSIFPMEPMGWEIQMEPKRSGDIWPGKVTRDQENRAGRSFLRWVCVSPHSKYNVSFRAGLDFSFFSKSDSPATLATGISPSCQGRLHEELENTSHCRAAQQLQSLLLGQDNLLGNVLSIIYQEMYSLSWYHGNKNPPWKRHAR